MQRRSPAFWYAPEDKASKADHPNVSAKINTKRRKIDSEERGEVSCCAPLQLSETGSEGDREADRQGCQSWPDARYYGLN